MTGANPHFANWHKQDIKRIISGSENLEKAKFFPTKTEDLFEDQRCSSHLKNIDGEK